MTRDKDPDYPCGSTYAKEFCQEHDLDPELWGHVNNVALDGHEQCRQEILSLLRTLKTENKQWLIDDIIKKIII